jgi:hypothetical protein
MTTQIGNRVALVIMIIAIPQQQHERSAMNTTMKLVAWICIFSTGVLGCTSTALIRPEGENQEKPSAGEIESVIMKDGTKYEFEGTQRAAISAGMVRGISEGKTVAIPLSDVDKMRVRGSDTGLTIIMAVVGTAAFVGLIVGFSEAFKSTAKGIASLGSLGK